MRSHLLNQNLILFSLILAVGLVGCATWKQASIAKTPASNPPTGTTYRLKRIADGDTMTVVDGRGVNTKVRFACIDTAEVPHTKKERESYNLIDLAQFKWGRLARNRLTQLIHQGGDRVALTVVDRERNRFI